MVASAFIDEDLGKRLPRNRALVEKAVVSGTIPSQWREAEKLAYNMRFFHWEVEFPDAFNDRSRGFDLVVMNPPWENVKPEDDDFFSPHSPDFRRIKSKPDKLKVMQKLLKDQEVNKAYEGYKKEIESRVDFYKKSGLYVMRGSGDTNLWKLFTERALQLTSKNGGLSILLPSGIVTDEGAKQLREELLKHRIRAMYEFENKLGIFPDVHRSYKYVLLVVDKVKPEPSFKAAFYLHQLDAIKGKSEQEKFINIPINLIYKSAPDSFSIPEIRNAKQLEVFEHLYSKHPLLGDEKKGWTVALIAELHRTAASKLLKTDGKGWPFIEGKNFHQFILDYEKTMFTVDPDKGLDWTSKIREYKGINEKVHRDARLAFRGVASSTNVRSMVACIIPKNTLCSNSAIIVLPKLINTSFDSKTHNLITAYLAGILNSLVFDYLLRTRITMNVNFFFVYQTPVPKDYGNELAQKIIEIVVKLSSVDDRFNDLASLTGIKCAPLKMKERIELTAQLNALVAKHYDLSRDQLGIVLQSFQGFEEDPEIIKIEEPNWGDALIRSFNGEVRKRVLKYFDEMEEAT
jgi:Alw26I/Eco31I/Esp3I family type II restriction m6 adenine DNA methyltransferase